MSTKQPLIRARGLTKLFNQTMAVDHIDFDIYHGEAVGFLGPNGAGKTTTIRMLLNLLNPSLGELTLFGLNYHDSRTEILRQMNSTSGSMALPGRLTVNETLKVFADLYGIHNPVKRIETLLQKFDLNGLKNNRIYSLSTGQQVRVSLAKAFLNHPRILLLDEPTASLDPDVADRVRQYLMDVVKSEGTTLFLTSHNMREVETVCSRVLFLNHGQIKAEGSPRDLAKRVKQWSLTIKTKKTIKELPRFKSYGPENFNIDDKILTAELDNTHIGPFLTNLVQSGIEIDRLSIKEPSLEDFFVHTTRSNK